ncbi:family 2 putative glycosyltransferase [Triangularia verruculosa]|uniref:Family 2 putative glycosyltransferase n=1 Tax=Triangularia verruculosa TaxID=2587418 RepID=A0AAN7ATC7_9PEZI|nr:family 2 putative glycosyltransferase [Triangularia verruculosa]
MSHSWNEHEAVGLTTKAWVMSTDMPHVTSSSKPTCAEQADEKWFDTNAIDNGNLGARIQTLADTEETSTILFCPYMWQRYLSRFLAFTAALPALLILWAAFIQGTTICSYWAGFGSSNISLSKLQMTLATLFFVIEILWAVDQLLVAYQIKSCSLFGTWRPRLRIVGDTDLPSVDVIILICKEPEPIVYGTVLAVLDLDYPLDKLRVIVTDDGGDSAVKTGLSALVSKLGNVFYTANCGTGKEKPPSVKAANLNNALRFIDSLPGGRAELVAVLDVDMIPDRVWLRATVPHFFSVQGTRKEGKETGLVCAVPTYYNIPDNDPTNQSNFLRGKCYHPVLDQAGMGQCTGTGWVMRRKALDSLPGGQIPTNCVCEDHYTHVLLEKTNHWVTASVAEYLQCGVVPDTYQVQLKQYTRWFLSSIAVTNLLHLSGHSWIFLLQKLLWKAPLAMVGIIMLHLKNHMSTLQLLLFPLLFLTKTPLVITDKEQDLVLLLRLHSLSVLLSYLHHVHVGVMAGYRASIMDWGMTKWLSPHYTVAYLKTYFPSLLNLFQPKKSTTTTATTTAATNKPSAAAFVSTGSIKDKLFERFPGRRGNLTQRLNHILLECEAWMHLAAVTAILTTAWFAIKNLPDSSSSTEKYLNILLWVAWPSNQSFIVLATACFTPVKYAIWPPGVGEGVELLKNVPTVAPEAPTSFIFRPREEARRWEERSNPIWGGGLDFVTVYTVWGVWAGLVFVWTWWL